MGLKLRPELSKKNKYWIDKNRFYELNYSYDLSGVSGSGSPSDPIGDCIEERSIYFERMQLIEETARETDPYLASYILKAVTEGLSFTYLQSILEIPCSRDTYYDRYRKFFWILSKRRD